MEDKKEGEVPRVSDRKNGWGIDITRGDEKKKNQMGVWQMMRTIFKIVHKYNQ